MEMTEEKRKMIKDFLDGCSKNVDNSLSFSEQVDYISEKMDHIIDLLNLDISIDDPEVKKMIKESVVVREEKPIVFTKGYTPWLTEERANIDWYYYNRFEEYLVKTKNWNWGAVQSINETTDIILDHMQNPKADCFYETKGLVMGDIQSGKTANYTALINKAVDAGYKFVIVLAGLTKDLRSQTQKRLDKEVLGYETRAGQKKGNPIGVGIGSSEEQYIIAITHSGESGDLKKSTAEAITNILCNGMQPLIAVVKKNSTVLKAILNTILSSDSGAKTNGKFDVPVLVIDDEVDQASVNTKDNAAIAEASAINKYIRTMLSRFNRYAYVGYTATPFANVFINPFDFNENEKDIFPEDFIICLPRPKNYCGVSEYFGIDIIDDQVDNDAITLDLYNRITDYYDMFDDEVRLSKKVKVDTPVIRINKSMEDAFMHFIIASAVKYSRGIVEHNSMLIHIARFKNPATSLRDLVKEKLLEMFHSYKYGGEEDRLKYKEYWEKRIKPVSEGRLMSDFCDSWNEIEKHITQVFEMTIIGIKVVNGDSADVCDYESSNVGQHIIIGGDKLSRGLTLEGLIVSYYYRNTRTYDTLLQMGRWFGYRNGWIDLCRIYTTNELVNSFINAGIATEEFKSDIEEMNALKLSPSQFGLKIKYSPRLAPTSASKMRLAKKQKVSFSGTLQQLLSYRKDYVEQNRALTDKFLVSLGESDQVNNGNVVYRNVSSTLVLDFLRQYKECDELVGSVSIKNWVNYISKLNKIGELTDWTVILHSNSDRKKDDEDIIAGHHIYKNRNTDRNLYATDEMRDLYLKAVTSPSDFKEFYVPESNEYKIINAYKANDELIKSTFSKEHGVLAIYSMDVYKKVFDKEIELHDGRKRKMYKQGELLKGGNGVIGLGAWFSISGDYESSAVEYYVNPIFLENMNSIDEDNDL